MENMIEKPNVTAARYNRPNASSGFEHGDVYQLSAEKLSRNKQKIERREIKDRISDRRSQMRLGADGKAQPDRRKANRLAYAEMYSRLRKPH